MPKTYPLDGRAAPVDGAIFSAFLTAFLPDFEYEIAISYLQLQNWQNGLARPLHHNFLKPYLINGRPRNMVEALEIDGVADGLAELAVIARDWWLADDARLLPGETNGVTVFEILYEDGCRYFGYTGESVFERLEALSNGWADVRSNGFVSEHCRQMPYVVRCVASSLDRGEARALRELLVAEAPDGGLRIDGTTVMSPNCSVQEGDDGVEVMSFAEWAKTTNGGFKKVISE